MSGVRERDIEKELLRAVTAVGGIAYKFTSPQRSNVPDRVCVFPGGKLIFIELKAPGEEASDAQEREHARLRALGQRVVVVDSHEGVAAIVAKVLWNWNSL